MKLPPNIDRYEVIDRLGRGGMGIVYRARDPRLGRTVAIKVLATDDEEFRKRFLQEAQLAATLHHRNIVTVFDYGEQDTGPFIVMEYIEGATIADHLQRGTPLSLDRKLELLHDLAIAIDYAHNHGIVHRDIKPANLMIDRDGLLKVLDFGVARLSESQLTQVGAMIGTPSYMAPEQIEGRPADRRTDVFAVGVTAYELLSSQKAFPDQTSVLKAILLEDPVPLRTVCPGLDPNIERIVKTAIRKDPTRRYSTLALMATDIKRALDRHRSVPDEESTRPVATMARTRARSGSDIPQAMERARRAFAQGRYESAIAAAAEVLESEPNNPEALDLTRLALGAFERSRATAHRPPDEAVTGVTGGQRPAVPSSSPRRNAVPIAVGVAAILILLTAAALLGMRWLKSTRKTDGGVTGQTVVQPLPPQPNPVPAPQPVPTSPPATTSQPATRGRGAPDAAEITAKVDAGPRGGRSTVPSVVTPATGWQGLQVACDRGEAAKCLELGQAYQSGNGPQKDVVRAAALFQRGCELGIAQACNELGVAYRTGVGVPLDLGRAVMLYQRACDTNYGPACNNLGFFYSRGLSVGKDEPRAASLYQRACDSGDAAGCENAGRAFEFGLGAPRDIVRAVSFYQRGCTATNGAACASLGWALFRGAGIDKDESRAVSLFRRACDEGISAGCNNLGRAMEDGRGTTKDEKRAVELYQQACDKNNAFGCLNLAWIYQRGIVLPRDEARATMLFQRSCDAGNANGCINVGVAYAFGRGVAKDEVRAVSVYQRACDAGAGDGCTRAAAMYDQGRGVAKDANRAAALNARGRELGGRDANDPTTQTNPSSSGVNTAGQVAGQQGRDTKPTPATATAMSPAGAVSAPARLKEVKPEYPTAALYARAQGDVVLEVTIGADGAVTKTRVVQSIPLLDAAAEDAVKQWRFAPTVVNGKAVTVTMPLTVKFSLNNPTSDGTASGRGR